MNEKASHPAVPHAVRLRLRADLRRYEKGLPGKIAAGNDWLATHLGVIFGSVWVVWTFFIWPLAAQFMDALIQQKTSYYAQSWVQLFALPLFVYIGNRLQRSSDAQSDAMHQALTHIATTGDASADRLDLATEGGLADLMTEVKSLRSDVAAVRTLVTPTEAMPVARPRKPATPRHLKRGEATDGTGPAA